MHGSHQELKVLFRHHAAVTRALADLFHVRLLFSCVWRNIIKDFALVCRAFKTLQGFLIQRPIQIFFIPFSQLLSK
jgi:hypothetical protein